jgi:hypothetical protein
MPRSVKSELADSILVISTVKSGRKESLTISVKYPTRNQADALEEAYEANIEAWIPEKPHPAIKGIDVILREMAVAVKDPVHGRPARAIRRCEQAKYSYGASMKDINRVFEEGKL